MRRDDLYLTDIVEAAGAIESFLGGVPSADFAGNDLLRSAVLQKLTIIGEAAARLSADFRRRHAAIEWADIAAFRNIAVHAYFSVDWSIVWTTATEEAPALAENVAQILAAESRKADTGSGPDKNGSC